MSNWSLFKNILIAKKIDFFFKYYDIYGDITLSYETLKQIRKKKYVKTLERWKYKRQKKFIL